MPRSRGTVIDDDNSWIIREEFLLDPLSPTAPEDDFWIVPLFPIFTDAQTSHTQIVIWGVGLVSVGPVTAAQRTFMANLGSSPDLSAFPGDWVAFGFSNQQLDRFEYGVQEDLVYVTSGTSPMITFTPDTLTVTGITSSSGVFGWDYGGRQFTSTSNATSTLFFSDLDVTSGTPGPDPMTGTDGPETLLGLGGNDHLIGNGGGDKLDGGDDDDLLEGNAGNDRLYGGEGNDTLDGGDGDDQLFGGDGDDLLIPGLGRNLVDGGAGIDTVQTDRSFTLGRSVENLVLTGAANINGTGNAAANRITGNNAANTLNGAGGNDSLDGAGGNDRLRGAAGNDTLNGGLGNDTLTGGAGGDGYLFDTPLNGANNVDRLTDFDALADTIILDRTIFAQLATGALPASAFVAGDAAQDADDRIVYDSDDGRLWYDADGSGAGAQILFALLVPNTVLTEADMLIVA